MADQNEQIVQLLMLMKFTACADMIFFRCLQISSFFHLAETKQTNVKKANVHKKVTSLKSERGHW
jgi:hypothetical protein